MTNIKPIIARVETTAAVLTTDLVATAPIMEVVKWAKVHKQQMENAKRVYEEACKIIKDYMQLAEVLISPDGCLIATYKQNKSYMTLDKEALKLNFADIYDVCLKEHKGNRPFELK